MRLSKKVTAVSVGAAMLTGLGAMSALASNHDDKVTICHKPGTPAEQTKRVPPQAVPAHLGHGDRLGPCTPGGGNGGGNGGGGGNLCTTRQDATNVTGDNGSALLNVNNVGAVVQGIQAQLPVNVCDNDLRFLNNNRIQLFGSHEGTENGGENGHSGPHGPGHECTTGQAGDNITGDNAGGSSFLGALANVNNVGAIVQGVQAQAPVNVCGNDVRFLNNNTIQIGGDYAGSVEDGEEGPDGPHAMNQCMTRQDGTNTTGSNGPGLVNVNNVGLIAQGLQVQAPVNVCQNDVRFLNNNDILIGSLFGRF